MTEKTKYYPEIQAKADFPALEQEILNYWRADDTFKKSVANRAAGEKGSNEYVFMTALRLPTACRITGIW